jgi:hypothetical protein
MLFLNQEVVVAVEEATVVTVHRRQAAEFL